MDARIPVDAETCNAILVARMGKVDAFKMITQEELAQMAGYQAMLQSLGEGDDVDALRKLGEAANADRLISGVIGDVGGTAAATLTLLNVHSGEVEKRIAGTAKGARDLILPLLNGQADGMLAYLLKTYAPERMKTARAPTTPTSTPPEAAPGESAPKRAIRVVGPLALAFTSGAFGFALAALGGGMLTLVALNQPVLGWGFVAPAILVGGGLVALMAGGVGVVTLVVSVVLTRV